MRRDAADSAAASTVEQPATVAGDVRAARLAIPGSLAVWAFSALAMAANDDIREFAIGETNDTPAPHLAVILACGGLVCLALAVFVVIDLSPRRIARLRQQVARRLQPPAR